LEDLQNIKKKFVITSSSYPALKQLAQEGLGGGRSYTVQMFPLDFEEYLYFSGKISGYNEDYNPTVEDVENFYKLKDVPQGMDMVIDREYLTTTFEDILIATNNKQFAERGVFLDAKNHNAILDILSYTLNSSSIDLSSSLISYVNEKTRNISPESLATILAYLLTNAFVFVDLTMTESSVQKVDGVISSLLSVKNDTDLISLLKEYTFLPLYTRVMVDLEIIADKLSERQLYKLAIKTVIMECSTLLHSYKYSDADTDEGVDLYVPNTWDKPPLFLGANHNVNKFLKEREFIRVVTDLPDVWKEEDGYYLIGYPKALLMLANRTIFALQPSALE